MSTFAEKVIEEETEEHDADEDDDEDADSPHIMISYQWGVQPMMLRVRDRLKEAGYKVWMDVDEMCPYIFITSLLCVIALV